MPWAKLDDGFYDHEKVLRAGLAATGLFVRALSYCARKMNDGQVPAAVLPVLAAGEDAKPLTARLVDVGLFEKTPAGFQIHDYLHYNPSRKAIIAARSEHRSSRERGGDARVLGALRDGMGRFSSSPSSCSPADGPAEAPPAHQLRSSPVPEPVPISTLVLGSGNGIGAKRAPGKIVNLPSEEEARAKIRADAEALRRRGEAG